MECVSHVDRYCRAVGRGIGHVVIVAIAVAIDVAIGEFLGRTYIRRGDDVRRMNVSVDAGAAEETLVLTLKRPRAVRAAAMALAPKSWSTSSIDIPKKSAMAGRTSTEGRWVSRSYELKVVRLMPIRAAASRWSSPSSARRVLSALPMVCSLIGAFPLSGCYSLPYVCGEADGSTRMLKIPDQRQSIRIRKRILEAASQAIGALEIERAGDGVTGKSSSS